MRLWQRNNPDHPLTGFIGGAELYHEADAAARSAYNGGRNAGLTHEAARQSSYEAYWEYLNQGRGTGVSVSRRTLFEQIDRPTLRPLLRTRYELATWQPCRVNIDYHVHVDHNFYSVPYQLVHARVEARVTQLTVEVFFKGHRVASHTRLTGRGRFSTQIAHMPHAHRAHVEWTPSRLIAVSAGPICAVSWGGGCSQGGVG